MEAKASKHASKCEHACARARVCACARVRVRACARVRVRACACACGPCACACARAQPNGDAVRRGPRRGWATRRRRLAVSCAEKRKSNT